MHLVQLFSLLIVNNSGIPLVILYVNILKTPEPYWESEDLGHWGRGKATCVMGAKQAASRINKTSSACLYRL